MTTRDSSDAITRQATRLFLWSGFVWRFCTAAYWMLFFIRVVVDVGLSPLELILLGTAKEVTILVVEIPTGVVADLRSRRLSVILSFLLCGVAIVGAGLAQSFFWLAATQILWAFGSTFRSGAETAWYTDEVRSLAHVDSVLPQRGRRESAGSIFGVLGSAVLASVVGLTPALIAVGVVLLAWGIVLRFRMRETGFQRVETPGLERAKTIFTDGLTASRRPALRILLIATVMTGFASEAVDRLQIARLDQIGFPIEIDVALVVGGAIVVEAILSITIIALFGSRLAGKSFVPAAAALHAVTGVGVFLLAGSEYLVVALVGLVAAGASRDVARTVTTGWTNHFTDQDNRATVHSFVGQAMSLGEITGGLILGTIAQQLGLTSALIGSALIYLAASIVAGMGKSRWDLKATLRVAKART